MRDALAGLLARASGGDAIVLADDIVDWPAGSVTVFEGAGLLVRIDNGASLRCDGCEERCLVTPEWRRPRTRPASLVHACHRPRDIGLVVLDAARLRRWRVDLRGFGAWLARELHLVGGVEERVVGRLWRLGERTVGSRRSIFLATGDVDTGSLVAPSPLVLGTAPLDAGDAPAVAVTAILLVNGDRLVVDDVGFVSAFGAPKRKASVVPMTVSAGLRWDQVILRVLEDDLVEVVLGNQPAVHRTSADLGLRDARDGSPTEAWRLLLALAEEGGTLNWGARGADDKRKAQIHRLRRALEAAIPAEGEAIPDYRKGRTGWAATFRIVDRRRP